MLVRTQDPENFDEEVKPLVTAWCSFILSLPSSWDYEGEFYYLFGDFLGLTGIFYLWELLEENQEREQAVCFSIVSVFSIQEPAVALSSILYSWEATAIISLFLFPVILSCNSDPCWNNLLEFYWLAIKKR